MNKKKNIILIVVVIVVIIIGVSVLVISKTNKKEEEKVSTFADVMNKYQSKGYVPAYLSVMEEDIESGLKIEDRIDIYWTCDSFTDEMKNKPFANNLIFAEYRSDDNNVRYVVPQHIYEYIKYTYYISEGPDSEVKNCKFTVKKSNSKVDDDIKMNNEIKKWIDERIMLVED